jgi:argininosuccinate synthase
MSLYRPDLASFDMAGYDSTHAEGFIRLFGLPLAVGAARDRETEAERVS